MCDVILAYFCVVDVRSAPRGEGAAVPARRPLGDSTNTAVVKAAQTSTPGGRDNPAKGKKRKRPREGVRFHLLKSMFIHETQQFYVDIILVAITISCIHLKPDHLALLLKVMLHATAVLREAAY